MRRAILILVCLCLIVPQSAVDAYSQPTEDAELQTNEDVIERTVTARGTEYTIRVNTSNHTVQVSAVHFASNKTNAGYIVQMNDKRVIDVLWDATEGEESSAEANLMYQYDAKKEVRNITFSTYHGSANMTYNFTVPRKYEGRYLRPTVTDVDFERINQSWGRMTVTVRSDAEYYYPDYVVVWTPHRDAVWLDLHREKGENVTTDSLLVRVEEGQAFQGELRMHTGNLSKSGPLHTQYEFYGRQGNVSLSEVPYEPVSPFEFDQYSYENKSRSTTSTQAEYSDFPFRTVIGTVGVLLVVGIVVAVVVSRRRRV